MSGRGIVAEGRGRGLGSSALVLNMGKSGKNLLLGIGILAIISGIYFMVQGNYVEGIIGSIVGLFVVVLQGMKGSEK